MAMVAEKAERLLNLVILLLVARNYTTKEQIRALMEPYRASSDEAFTMKQGDSVLMGKRFRYDYQLRDLSMGGPDGGRIKAQIMNQK